MWEVPWASGPGRGARGTPLSVGVWEPRGRRAPVPPATLRVPDWDWAVLPGVCLRWPLLGLWPHLPVLLCVLVSLTLSTRPPPPRRRVSGSGAPRAAPAQRGAAPAEAAGPPARPAEPLLLCHPGGERCARLGTSRQPPSSSWSPKAGDYASQQRPGRRALGCPCVSSGIPWEL